MAKRTIVNPKANAPIVTPATTAAKTETRKTVIPKPAPAAAPKKAPKPITYEMISERAYFIAMSGNGGSQDDNWLRAEAELKKESTL